MRNILKFIGLLILFPALAYGQTTVGPIDSRNLGMTPFVATGGTTARTLGDWFWGIDKSGSTTLFTGGTTFSGSGTGLAVTNNATVGGTLGVTGATTIAGSFTASGNATVYSAAGGGTGTLAVGAGSTNHLSLSAASLGTPPSITATGSNGLSIITQNNGPINLGAPTSVNGNFTDAVGTVSINNGGAGEVVSGSTYYPFLNSNFNISGQYTADNNVSLHEFLGSSDTLDMTDGGAYPNLFLTDFYVDHVFGGPGTAGNRQGAFVRLWEHGAITNDTSDKQYVGLTTMATADSNVGGTNDNSASKGYLYGGNPNAILSAGATHWTLLNGLGEVDTAVVAMTQTVAVSGTITAGDVVTLTFTSSSITGSPLAISHTVQTGDTVDKIATALISAIRQNTALNSIGLTATPTFGHTLQPVNLTWQTGTTVSVTETVSSGATEVVTLGTAPVAGASVQQKFGASFVRLSNDGQHGNGALYSPTGIIGDPDIGLIFTSQEAPETGAWDQILGVYPDAILPTSSLIRVNPFSTLNGGGGKIAPLEPAKLTYGLHLAYVDFADQSGFPLFTPGFSVNGTGTVAVGNGDTSYGANGLTTDVTGYVGSGNAAVVSGGGGGAGVDVNNYFVGDLIYDNLGGQHIVTSVNSGTGAVTGLRTIVQPWTRGTLPATTQATIGGSGTGLTIGVSWSASTTLSLQPSGGDTVAGGTLAAAAYKVGATAGASCAAGSVSLATLVVTNGIVTHC